MRTALRSDLAAAPAEFGSDQWFLRTASGRSVLAGAVAVALTALPSHVAPTHYNNYVLFANALLHHRLWIDWPGPAIDAVLWKGQRYIVNDPVPGLLLLPLVALFGPGTNQTVLAVVLAGVAVGAAWRAAERLGLPLGRTVVLVAFFFAGTDLWWGSTLGDVWFLAQTSAVAFLTLALAQLTGAAPRGALVGLAYALAVGSRFTLVMALPVVAFAVYRGGLQDGPRHAGGARRLAAFALVVAAFAALWAWYNQVRWGVWYDRGHTIFFHQDSLAGGPTGSPFSWHNLPLQLQSFLLAPPELSDVPPFVTPSFKGTALTYTSPALLLAFFARRPRFSVRAMWLATALVAAPSLLYYVNGASQYGMRHALDFEPFLFVLMVLAARIELPRWAVYLTIYSIGMSVLGIWYWLAIIRPEMTR
jgi:hypothetical protein